MITPPTTTFDEAPRKCVSINETWISHLVGLIDRASNEWYWDTGDKYEATQQIEQIIRALTLGNCEPSMIGTIQAFAGSVLPSGALWCDGATYDRVDYPALYEVLDTIYIEDADTFTVPDLRAKFIVGVNEDDLGEDVSNYDVGDTGGEESHVLGEFEVGQHTHGISPHNHTYDQPANEGLEAQAHTSGSPVPVPEINASQNTGMQTISTDANVIETLPHENRPPFLALRYFIVAR